MYDTKDLVDRFLAWPLPQSICSDVCATDAAYKFPRSGTNLLNADEARQMVEYLCERLIKIEEAAMALSTAMVENEDKGADFELVDEEWMQLTAALQPRRLIDVNG